MARGENTGGHPNRNVTRARFDVGDVVHIPSIGPTRVTAMDKRYFVGETTTSRKRPVGKTGIRLAEGAGMVKNDPWKVEKKT